jgi:hypothetical protein
VIAQRAIVVFPFRLPLAVQLSDAAFDALQSSAESLCGALHEVSEIFNLHFRCKRVFEPIEALRVGVNFGNNSRNIASQSFYRSCISASQPLAIVSSSSRQKYVLTPFHAELGEFPNDRVSAARERRTFCVPAKLRAFQKSQCNETSQVGIRGAGSRAAVMRAPTAPVAACSSSGHCISRDGLVRRGFPLNTNVGHQ